MNSHKEKEITKQLNNFALPLVMNNFINILLTTILTGIIARISLGAIAQTEAVSNLINSILGIVGVGSLSFNIYSSKVMTKNKAEFYSYFKSILIINFTIGLIFMILVNVYSKNILAYLYAFKGDILSISSIYFKIMSIEILLTMVNFSLTNFLKVSNKTKSIMIIGMISGIFNLIASFVLVYYVFSGKARIYGIAIASVLSNLIQSLYYIYIVKFEIIKAFKVKASKISFLIKKSIPLVIQEFLEGSIFILGVTAFISQISLKLFASYSISMKLVFIALAPMYMYANSVIVSLGESIEKEDKDALKLIPKIATKIIFGFYILLALVFLLFREKIFFIFTDKVNLINNSKIILPSILFFSSFQIFFEISKYSLQTLGEESKVLKITGFVNLIIFIVMAYINIKRKLSLNIILSLLAINYLILAFIFQRLYKMKRGYIVKKFNKEC